MSTGQDRLLPLMVAVGPVDSTCTEDSDAVASLAANAGVDCPLGGRDRHTPALVAAQLTVGALALAGNGLVAHLIRSTSSLHTPNNLFVCALAVADMLVAANVPFYVTFYFDVPYKCDRTLCAIRWGKTNFDRLSLFFTLPLLYTYATTLLKVPLCSLRHRALGGPAGWGGRGQVPLGHPLAQVPQPHEAQARKVSQTCTVR